MPQIVYLGTIHQRSDSLFTIFTKDSIDLMQVSMLDMSFKVVAVNHCRKVFEFIEQPCSVIVVFANLFNFKDIVDVLPKLYPLPLLSLIVFLLLHYFSSSLILELLNGLEVCFGVDMTVQKIDESGFENR